jgi:hypothetical protein
MEEFEFTTAVLRACAEAVLWETRDVLRAVILEASAVLRAVMLEASLVLRAAIELFDCAVAVLRAWAEVLLCPARETLKAAIELLS